jgi:hypothetical protein
MSFFASGALRWKSKSPVFQGPFAPRNTMASPFIEKHLCRAAGVLFWIIRHHFKEKPDIANAGPDVCQLPRRFWLSFVIKPGCKIPRHRRRVLQSAYWIARPVQEFVRNQCGLADKLRGVSEFQQTRLHLAVKIGHVIENFLTALIDDVPQ